MIKLFHTTKLFLYTIYKMALFTKNKVYCLEEIIGICNKNGLITVDCLKDENMISIEEEGSDCLFEFLKIEEDGFKLSWVDPNLF